MGIFLRWLGAFSLLSITYNPTQYNFTRWVEANWSAQMPLALLFDYGILSLQNPSLNLWLGIFALSSILGIGLSWSILRQRLSGQATVDEVES